MNQISVDELYERIEFMRDEMSAEMDYFEGHEEYTEEERMYDDGYINALEYVMHIIERVEV